MIGSTLETMDDGTPWNPGAFFRDGFAVWRAMVDPPTCAALADDVRDALDPVLGPAEFEADVGYPGAPPRRDAAGGDTPRRLLHAYSRFRELRPLVTGLPLAARLRVLLGLEPVDRLLLSQCHHNCVMTKSPGFSSRSLWHQDIRYWSFQRPELVSLWLALGHETAENGALQLIPGSHHLELSGARWDEARFLRPELAENRSLIERAQSVELHPGDALLFHCRTLHAAGRNETDQTKLSAVFTYYAGSNPPTAGTRSAQYAGIELPR